MEQSAVIEPHTIHEKKSLEITFPFLCYEMDDLSFPLHWHDCFEIMLITKGGMNISIDDTLYDVSAGDFIFVNSGAVHGYFNSQMWMVLQGVQFSITLFDESFVNLRDIIFQNPVLGKNTVTDSVCARMRQLFQEMCYEYNEKAIGYQLAVKSKLYELMFTLLRSVPKQPLKEESSKQKQILGFVLKNIDDPDLTLEEAAEALNFNKYYFSHFFKKHTGQSFHSYLVQTRVKFAKHYLIESKMPVTDVAFQSGFNSIQTFNRAFKTLTGFTPTDYRRENSASPVNFVESFFIGKNTQNNKK